MCIIIASLSFSLFNSSPITDHMNKYDDQVNCSEVYINKYIYNVIGAIQTDQECIIDKV